MIGVGLACSLAIRPADLIGGRIGTDAEDFVGVKTSMCARSITVGAHTCATCARSDHEACRDDDGGAALWAGHRHGLSVTTLGAMEMSVALTHAVFHLAMIDVATRQWWLQG